MWYFRPCLSIAYQRVSSGPSICEGTCRLTSGTVCRSRRHPWFSLAMRCTRPFANTRYLCHLNVLSIPVSKIIRILKPALIFMYVFISKYLYFCHLISSLNTQNWDSFYLEPLFQPAKLPEGPFVRRNSYRSPIFYVE